MPTTLADTLFPDDWGWGPLVQGLAGAGAPAVGGHLSIAAAGHTVHAGNAAAATPNCLLCPSTHAAALSLLALLGYQDNPVAEAVQAWLAHEAQPAAAGPAAQPAAAGPAGS